MEVDLNRKVKHLLNSKLIGTISEKQININGKGRIYNQTKPSIILTEVVDSLYNKQFPEEPKPTRRIRKVKEAPPNSANVLLKYDTYKRVDRTKFQDFQNDFYIPPSDTQGNAQIVELKFRVEIEKGNEETDNMEIYINEKLIEARTIYGGVDALKLYLNHNTAYVVRKYEDSGVTVKQIF